LATLPTTQLQAEKAEGASEWMPLLLFRFPGVSAREVLAHTGS
jgi:hypothetical protein